MYIYYTLTNTPFLLFVENGKYFTLNIAGYTFFIGNSLNRPWIKNIKYVEL